ncbi:MAG: ImmA/IrrE family metallo-endopeptidase [Thermoplasmata archaeon]
MTYLVKNYNKEILKSLARQYPEKWEQVKSSKKGKWLTGESFPSYNQLVKIAKVFNIPFGYLFLDSLPERVVDIPYFRTGSREKEKIIDENLKEFILQVKRRQEWIKEILLEWEYEPLPFAGKYSSTSDVNTVVAALRETLKLKDNWAKEVPRWNDALRFLIERVEEAGIFVIVSGVVGNDTRRKISLDVCRGFVLFDPIAPFVYLNSNDFISAKIFTLIHELVHILIGQSASFDLRELQSADDEVERFCDKCAAEFLVPATLLQQEKVFDFEYLAQKYKVSQIVIARRLLDIGKITKNEYLNFYHQYKKYEHKTDHPSGGDFYITAEYRYSKKFLRLIYLAWKENKVLYRDLCRLLSLSASTLDTLFNRLFEGFSYEQA